MEENSGWATFGKVAAGLAGAAAIVGALYGVGNVIYNEGVRRGTYDAEDVMRTQYGQKIESLRGDHDRELKSLDRDGRLLPKDSCLRYFGRSNQGRQEEGIEGQKKCAGLNTTVVYDGGKTSQVVTEFNGQRVVFDRHGSRLEKLTQAKWEKTQ